MSVLKNKFANRVSVVTKSGIHQPLHTVVSGISSNGSNNSKTHQVDSPNGQQHNQRKRHVQLDRHSRQQHTDITSHDTFGVESHSENQNNSPKNFVQVQQHEAHKKNDSFPLTEISQTNTEETHARTPTSSTWEDAIDAEFRRLQHRKQIYSSTPSSAVVITATDISMSTSCSSSASPASANTSKPPSARKSSLQINRNLNGIMNGVERSEARVRVNVNALHYLLDDEDNKVTHEPEATEVQPHENDSQQPEPSASFIHRDNSFSVAAGAMFDHSAVSQRPPPLQLHELQHGYSHAVLPTQPLQSQHQHQLYSMASPQHQLQHRILHHSPSMPQLIMSKSSQHSSVPHSPLLPSSSSSPPPALASPIPASVHVPLPPSCYVPYSLSDYRSLAVPKSSSHSLSLGPVETAEKEELRKIRRQLKEKDKKIRRENEVKVMKMKVKLQEAAIRRVNNCDTQTDLIESESLLKCKTAAQEIKKEKEERRKKMMEFARNVPKPKQREREKMIHMEEERTQIEQESRGMERTQQNQEANELEELMRRHELSREQLRKIIHA